MKALVTGASGFLGRALTARLRAGGIQVRALVRSGRGASVEADEISEGDVRDASSLRLAVAGTDWVFHAAARVSTGGAWEEFETVNVGGTRDVICLATEAGVRRIVHVSSLGVYAVASDGAVVSEEGPFEEASGERGYYARSKLEADRVALQAAAAGAPVAVVRPGLLYGPGRVPPLGRRVIALGPLRVFLASPGYLLPLAFVDNVADALVLAAQKPEARGRAYTIVDAHVRQADYARLYRRASGQRWIALYAPLGLIRLAVRAAEGGARMAGRRSPVTTHQLERTLRSATFEVRRAREELGWQPRISVEEGLRLGFDAGLRQTRGQAAAPARSVA